MSLHDALRGFPGLDVPECTGPLARGTPIGGSDPSAPTHWRVTLSVRRAVAAIATILLLSACSTAGEVGPSATRSGPSAVSMSMTVYRSPDCGCCHLWADIARRDGWNVASADKLDMTVFKAEVGVPLEVASCHTTLVGGYFVEGHVPLAAVERLLVERPDIDGIALPGMPAGSPGMAGMQGAPFEVLAVTDGVVTAFGSY
jgi:hypothetical protein